MQTKAKKSEIGKYDSFCLCVSNRIFDFSEAKFLWANGEDFMKLYKKGSEKIEKEFNMVKIVKYIRHHSL